MMRKSISTLLGFLLFGIGLMSLIFSLVGLHFTFLRPLYALGPGFAFLIYLVFIFAGGIILYISKTSSK